MSKSFLILYPDRRIISAMTINIWYSDAVANNEVAKEYFGIADTEPYQQALALHDAGIITLAARQGPSRCDTSVEEGTQFERAFGDRFE